MHLLVLTNVSQFCIEGDLYIPVNAVCSFGPSKSDIPFSKSYILTSTGVVYHVTQTCDEILAQIPEGDS